MEKETETKKAREGNLDAPTRHPIPWRDPQFTDTVAIQAELHRVFDICHGCRRCFNLCQSFPTLFDLIETPRIWRFRVSHLRITVRWSTSVICATCVT